MTPLHEQLRDLRKRRGLTMRELAPLIERSITTISQFEKGKVDTPIKQFTAWANALNADVLVVGRDAGARAVAQRALQLLSSEDLEIVVRLVQLLPKMSARDRAGLRAELDIIERF